MISLKTTEYRVLQSIGDANVIHFTTVVEMCHIFVLSNMLKEFFTFQIYVPLGRSSHWLYQPLLRVGHRHVTWALPVRYIKDKSLIQKKQGLWKNS